MLNIHILNSDIEKEIREEINFAITSLPNKMLKYKEKTNIFLNVTLKAMFAPTILHSLCNALNRKGIIGLPLNLRNFIVTTVRQHLDEVSQDDVEKALKSILTYRKYRNDC